MQNSTGVSYEFIRKHLNHVDKHEIKRQLFGELFATQHIRYLQRLHTYYPGQRTELDYTKFGLWLFPNEDWNEPLLFNTGLGIDHYSTVIKGHTVTIDPSTRDAVRLYRNCVLPKSLWLPDKLKHFAHAWDVFGLEETVVIDNAMDLVSDSALMMFVFFGVIVLRMPPRRGDLKGTVERTHYTVETQFASDLPGFIPSMNKLNSHVYTKIREAAKLKASLTVQQYEERLVPYITMDFNAQPHPRLKKPRINTWREGQTNHPILLPTGEMQIRAVFALTYEVKLTREGVQVNEVKYNSEALHIAFRTYSGPVYVKLNPDDIRTVLVILPNHSNPIEASLTTFELHARVTLEIFRIVMARLAAQSAGNLQNLDLQFAFPTELEKIQSGYGRTPGETVHSDAQAAAQASNLPQVGIDIATVTNVSAVLSKLLRDTKLSGKS